MNPSTRLPTTLLAVAGAFTAWRAASYVLHLGNVQRHHVESAWFVLAALRELVLADLDRASAHCSTVQAAGVPDSVSGAFVFRNGFPEAVADRIPRLTVIPDGAPAACRFVWNGSGFTQS